MIRGEASEINLPNNLLYWQKEHNLWKDASVVVQIPNSIFSNHRERKITLCISFLTSFIQI